MAEHFYGGLLSSEIVRDADFVARAVDLCYEIGAEQLQASQYETSIKWLQRAADFLRSDNDDGVRVNMEEMRLNVLHTLGTKPMLRVMFYDG